MRRWVSVRMAQLSTEYLTDSSIAVTLTIAFVTGVSYLLSLMFSTQNYAKVANTPTGLPLAELFHQATQTRGGAFALIFMIWLALGPCVIGSQLSELNYDRIDGQLLTVHRYRSCLLGLLSR